MSTVAIAAQGLSKQYQRGSRRADTLRDALCNVYRRALRRDEPDRTASGRYATHPSKLRPGRSSASSVATAPARRRCSRSSRASPSRRRAERSITAASRLLEVGTGFHPELTGRENVFLNGAILGMAKPRSSVKLERDRRVGRRRRVRRIHPSSAIQAACMCVSRSRRGPSRSRDSDRRRSARGRRRRLSEEVPGQDG